MRLPPFVQYAIPQGKLIRPHQPDSEWDFIFVVRDSLRPYIRILIYIVGPLYPHLWHSTIFLAPVERIRCDGTYCYMDETIDMETKLNIIMCTMSTIKPISDRVFLEAIEEDRVTKSGIVLPDSAEKERPIKGRVIAVGAGKLHHNGGRAPMSVKVGDIVLFKKYGPDEIELEGKKYLVAEENDILAVIE